MRGRVCNAEDIAYIVDRVDRGKMLQRVQLPYLYQRDQLQEHYKKHSDSHVHNAISCTREEQALILRDRQSQNTSAMSLNLCDAFVCLQ
jgi:hypothetical protein